MIHQRARNLGFVVAPTALGCSGAAMNAGSGGGGGSTSGSATASGGGPGSGAGGAGGSAGMGGSSSIGAGGTGGIGCTGVSSSSTGTGGSGGGAPSGSLLWAENFGTTYYTTPTSVAINPSNGDVVSAGYFYGTVNFGGGVLTSDPTSGSTDMFVARFDQNGGYKWAKNFGNGTGVVADAVAVGTSGKVFVGATALGAVNLGCGNLPQIGDSDALLAAFDSTACLWSKRWGVANRGQNVISLHVDRQENVIVGGLAWGGLNFGGGPLTGMYIAKFTKAGAHTWSKAFSGFQLGLDLPETTVDASGNIILAGCFSGFANFGGGVMTALGPDDAFVAKFDASGAFIWAKQYGDQDGQEVQVVATDPCGDIVVAGDFAGTIDFGAGAMTYIADEANLFVAKINPSGHGVWSRQFATSMGMGDVILTPSAISVDDSGGPIVAAGLRGPGFGAASVDFGGGSLSSQSNGDISLVMASFDAAGQYRWAISGGPPSVNGYSNVQGIAARKGTVVVAGQFGSDPNNATSPPGTTLVLPGKTLTAASGLDMYLAAFVP